MTGPPRTPLGLASEFPSERPGAALPDDFEAINRLDASFNVLLQHTQELAECVSMLREQVHAVRQRAERHARKLAQLNALLQMPDE